MHTDCTGSTGSKACISQASAYVRFYLSASADFSGMQLLERAAAWTELVGCQNTVHFHTANATVSLHSMLSSYPGPVQLVTIQVRQAPPSYSHPGPDPLV